MSDLLVTTEGQVGRLRLNRPGALHALNTGMCAGVLDALEAAVRTMQVKDAPGMTIVTDERDEWVIGDGALRVEGDREGILPWLARGDAENIYLPEGAQAPQLPTW